MALRTHRLARKLSGATAVAAALCLLATPVAARDYHGGHHRHHDHDDIDAGDVVAGVVILGAIAAITGAVNRHNRERYEQRYPVPPPQDNSGYVVPGAYQRADSIDRAVDLCVSEIERGRGRVDSVDSATRSADGWHVAGALESGAPYACTVGEDGRIGDVYVGDPTVAAGDGPRQDEAYTKAQVDEDLDDGRYQTAEAPDFAQ